MYDIHAEAARSLGYTPSDPFVTHFSLDDIALVRSVFPTAECHRFPNAFVFPTTPAALRYYASGWIDRIREWSEDDSHRARLLPLMEQRIEAVIAREGVFRVPKDSGCFVADT